MRTQRGVGTLVLCAAIALVAGALTVLAVNVSRPPRAAQVIPTAARTIAAPEEAGIVIDTFQFKPQRLEVRPGTRVVWTNQDDVLHTVTAGVPERPTGRFDGHLDGKGKTFAFTFDTPGTFPYFCARHEHMRGEVVARR